MTTAARNKAQLYFLKSPRAGFRLWTLDDLPLALSLWGDFKVTRLIDSRGQLSDAEVRDKLAKEIASNDAFGVQYWPVFLLSTGEFIGCGGLHPCRPEERVFELGVHLQVAYWGDGYASEVARAVIDYAFHQLNSSALFAGHHPKNYGSRRVLEKLGFQYNHDQHYPPTGLEHASYLLTRNDALARTPHTS
jgi:RimJ/RimL family protein N-acetyltransferase